MAKKKYKTSYNPITGQKEKVLKAGYYKDPFSGSIRKSRNTYSNRSYQRSRPMTKSEQKALVFTLMIVAIGFVLYQLGLWISTHIVASIIIGIILISGAILLYLKVPSVKNIFSRKINIFGKVKDDEVKDLINVIEGIKVQDVRNEEDFEKQLFQRLDAKDYRVKRQVSFGSGKRVDLVVDERIGIELKVADRAKNVQDLIGQVTIYKKHLKKIIVGILDCGVVADLSEYIELIQNIDEENINVVLIKGNLRRHKKREEYIMVKKTTSKY